LPSETPEQPSTEETLKGEPAEPAERERHPLAEPTEENVIPAESPKTPPPVAAKAEYPSSSTSEGEVSDATATRPGG